MRIIRVHGCRFAKIGLVGDAVVGAAQSDIAAKANLQEAVMGFEVCDSITGELIVAVVDMRGTDEDATATWEELEAATLAYGRLAFCRPNNANFPPEARVNCLEEMQQQRPQYIWPILYIPGLSRHVEYRQDRQDRPTKEIDMTSNALSRTLAIGLLTVVATATLLGPREASAQRTDDSYFRVTPYLWALSLDGSTAAPTGQDIPIDASFSDLLDNLNMALMINLEWNTKSDWFFLLDAMWANLESDFATPGPLPVAGNVDVEMTIYDGLVGYSINENLGVYIGARLNDHDITISTAGNVAPPINIGDDWTDYIIGLRVFGELSENWSMGGRLDGAIGGDSDSAFNAQFVFARHFGESMHLNLGWRYLDIEFDEGTGIERYKWDVSHSGPMIGWSWEF